MKDKGTADAMRRFGLYLLLVQRRNRLWWVVPATATVLAGAGWLRSPSAATVALFAAATLGAIVATWQERTRALRWSFLAAALWSLGAAGLGTREQARIARDPAAARAAVEATATAALARALENEADALRRLAAGALDAPAEGKAAFAHLDRLRGASSARSVVLVRGGQPVAWSGRTVTPLDSLAGPVGALGTPFYLTIHMIAGRGTDRAVAEALVHVERPADNLAEPVDQAIAARYGVLGFAYRDPSTAPADSFTIVRALDVPILGVRAVAPRAEVLESGTIEAARHRSGLGLAIALVLLLAAVWRDERHVGARLAALGMALVVVVLVPLSSFSNVSGLFDPAFFYVAGGGPFGGSIGALAITCTVVLLGLLATMRARLGARSRWQALFAVVVVASVGPFLLRDLARGIQMPAAGVTGGLWLAWEGTLFLAAVSVLIAGAAAGRAALGTRRGAPAWLAPLLAAGASLAAPALMDAPGAFPPWYPVWWIVAIGALAFARRGRGWVLAVAIVAACGSLTLVWGQTVHTRVLLAEADVAGLSTVDPGAAALLQRFPVQLDSATAPRTRVELLARYAGSDLANGDYPVDLTTWDPQGRRAANLRVSWVQATPVGIEVFAHEAQGATQPILRSTPGPAGISLVMAVPHGDRSVTTIVVAPRTRLIPRDAFGALIGIPGAGTLDPPYSLSLEAAERGSYISLGARWTRMGDELHGDWLLPSAGGGVVKLHARVDLRGYEALVTRGALIVLFDLLVLAALWLLLVVSDGAFGRWLRARRVRWLRSYRAQLTLALFAFFVLPAAAFAAWSYRRLQSDDAQSRDLLVRETLRGMTASSDSLRLAAVAAKFDTPLFLYQNGVLVGTSDPLLDALAPVGRLLPAAAARTIGDGDDVTASTEEMVGATPIRLGFRTVTVDSSGVRFVLAAPSRPDVVGLDRRRRDLGIFVLFATALGALGALWLSGLAARQFSRPIGALSSGALALAAGEREPRLAGDPPAEFQPVFSAFRQMARDLEAGRAQEAEAQRVLAWGEMARQVAHEIKNPLTPMRLGLQHLLRARHDPRVPFDQVLDVNVARMLAEIDRLDEIARAFSRYGTAPTERAPAESVDVAQVVLDVLQLERMGVDGVQWRAEGTDEARLAMARAPELREVLLNLLENARLASATEVTVAVEALSGRVALRVRDNGTGIAAEVLPRIFEPHFSTRTSGSGLGLAVSRRVIEGWGGTIAVESASGAGTTVTITLVAPRTSGQL